MNDGNIICNLTQHSKWNRKHHPLLLRKCKPRATVQNVNNVCQWIDDKEHLIMCNKYEDRFKGLCKNVTSEKNVDEHVD